MFVLHLTQPRAAKSPLTCCEDCLARCVCYSRFCGPICGRPPVFEVCTSPVDLRLRQLEAQERKYGSGAGNAVAASRISGSGVSSLSHGDARERSQSRGVYSSSSSSAAATGPEEGGSDARGLAESAGDVFVVYMPDRGADATATAEASSGTNGGARRGDRNGRDEEVVGLQDDEQGSTAGSVTSGGRRGVYPEHVRSPTTFGDVMEAIRGGRGSAAIQQAPLPVTMSIGSRRLSGAGDVILSRYVDLDEFGDDDEDSSSAISSTRASTDAPTPSSSSLSSDDEGGADADDGASDASSSASARAPTPWTRA